MGVITGGTTVANYQAKGKRKANKFKFKAAKYSNKNLRRGGAADSKFGLKASKLERKAAKIEYKISKMNRVIERNKNRTLKQIMRDNPDLIEAFKQGNLAYRVDQLGNVKDAFVSKNPEQLLNEIINRAK